MTSGRKTHFWSRPGGRLTRPLGRVLASPGWHPGTIIFSVAGAWLLPGFFLAFFAGAWPEPRSAPWLKPGWSLAGAWLEPGFYWLSLGFPGLSLALPGWSLAKLVSPGSKLKHLRCKYP